MAEAVRTRKPRSKSSAKAQDKKKKPAEELRKQDRQNALPELRQQEVSAPFGLKPEGAQTLDPLLLRPEEQKEDGDPFTEIQLADETGSSGVKGCCDSPSALPLQALDSEPLASTEDEARPEQLQTTSEESKLSPVKDGSRQCRQEEKTEALEGTCGTKVPELALSSETAANLPQGRLLCSDNHAFSDRITARGALSRAVGLTHALTEDEQAEERRLSKNPTLLSLEEEGMTNAISSSVIMESSTVSMVAGLMDNLQDTETKTQAFIKSPALLSLGDEEVTNPQLCGIMEDPPEQQSPFAKLYPDLPRERPQEETPSAPCAPRLYPEIPSELQEVPFTKGQLKLLEPGSWLENVDSYSEDFEGLARQEKHAFYELLMNYWRCRKQLLLAEAKLQSMTEDCRFIENKLWTFREEQLTVQVTTIYKVHMGPGIPRKPLNFTFFFFLNSMGGTGWFRPPCILLCFLAQDSFRCFECTGSRDVECLHSSLLLLKECIAVLFCFTRRVLDDAPFQSDVHHWLEKLVSVLHRIGSGGDHLYLLNHILRCPAGVRKWAVPFVQIKVLDNPSGVFHFMQSLALLMSPVKNRAEFMCHMKPSENRTGAVSDKESGNWTLVDEVGEEDEDPETSWMLLSEDDLIFLFSQFPFDELFIHLLGMNSKGAYQPERTSCQQMMKIFAFATSLVELLAVGLETFNRVRYRQFVKRIGHMIRLTICYVSDHWAQYVSVNKTRGLTLQHQPYSLDKLQVEFDELFLRAVLHVLRAKRYDPAGKRGEQTKDLMEEPSKSLQHETEMLSHLLRNKLREWLKEIPGSDKVDELERMVLGGPEATQYWKSPGFFFFFFFFSYFFHMRLVMFVYYFNSTVWFLIFTDPEHIIKFEEYLSAMNSSEGICLLTTFAHMAQPKRADVDEDFVKTTVLEIYKVSYVSLSTREIFSKVGRELLAAIATAHPQIISVILGSVRETMEAVGMNALGYHGDRGLLSSLVGWIVTGNVTPSFIEGNAESTEVWFSWVVLNMEAIFEEDSQLLRCVEQELVSNPSLTPEQALKKAQSRLKLPVVPSLQRLLIYRWAHQALATPADHPLLPLVWQKFFLLYLHRPGPEFGLPVSSCIGKRFFHSTAHVSLLKELKRRLTEVADFHHAASKALKVERSAVGVTGAGDERNQTPDYMTSPELHRELVRLFNVFAIWLEDDAFQKPDVYLPSLPKQYDTHRLAKIMQNQQDPWMEYIDMERMQHEFQEVSSLWVKDTFEPSAAFSSVSVFIDFTNPSAAKERILTRLKKHDAPSLPPLLQAMKAPVPDVAMASLTSEKAAVQLIQGDLRSLQQHAKLSALRESQQVALDSELLDTIPKLYCNREEQRVMELECRGRSGCPCQRPAAVTIKFESLHLNESIQLQLGALHKEIKQLHAEATKPSPQNIVEAAVHVENIITVLVNAYKLQSPVGTKEIGIALFYVVVNLVCDETQRHPPTRQFFTSCIEVLGQIFIMDSKSECKPLLKTILQNSRLCNLLSPYFIPNACPEEFVHLYEKVVKALRVGNGDVIFMLLTKFDLVHWLNSTKPSLSERTKLLNLIHLALIACGLQPEEEVLLPFNIFCKHWTHVLEYQFPDHYSDCLRLLMQSCAEQLLSPDCWKASLKTLGCLPPKKRQKPGRGGSTGAAAPPDSSAVHLSPDQVEETLEWLSEFFCKLRFSKSDFRSFGLFSKWGSYMAEVEAFFLFLVRSLINNGAAALAQEPAGSSKTLQVLQSLHSKVTGLFKPWILVLDTEDTSNRRCYPWLESDTPAATKIVRLFTESMEFLHRSFKDKLLPGQRCALWFHVIHYCESCASPKMPEYILYTYHSEYARLPWAELLPDHTLMEAFFKVERGSPKSCFLFLGSALCEVNWVSVLCEAWNPQPQLETQAMVVYLLFTMVFLSKEDELLSKPDTTLKCQAYIHQVVQFLSSLETSGQITLAVLEQELAKLLDDIALFNPPEVDTRLRHLAISSLFVEVLMMLNSASISTAESLRLSLKNWIEEKARCPLVLPLLTAACKCLASVRHMAETTEACITAFFRDGCLPDQYSGWGPILASLQVPELTAEEFLKECLSLESYLTLYVHALQRLNLEQTLAGETRALMMLGRWTEQAFPSNAKGEAKLFLWWHKALQLTLVQVEQSDASPLDMVIRTLLSLQARQSQLAEERLSSGILGAIGLGKKSPLSNRFRVVARSMSAFLLVQVPAENRIRLRPGTELQLSPKAQQALNTLESMASTKQYAEHQDQISQAVQFIRYPGHCLLDANQLLALLINSLYPEVHYLDIIR
nr:PREDICTED: ectopic P granules protein 5 homolog [Latimeria chalumnae]|eukprot:XP_014350649.1 PREDICTED: ectopic P granules protein 5 homolog [Latimeria chalumnae]